MKKQLISLMIISLMINGCAGLGANKKATLIPDQVKLGVKVNPQDNYNSKEIVGGASWNLK